MIQLNGDGTATLMGPNSNVTLTGVTKDDNGVIKATGGKGIINGKQTTGQPYKGNVLVIGPNPQSVKDLQAAPATLANNNTHAWFSGIGDLHANATLK